MSADYLKINGRTYAIAELPGTVDIEAKIEEFHKRKAKAVVDGCADAVAADVEREWNTQITRLRVHMDSRSLVIPASLNNKLTYNDGANVYEVRTMIYAPTEVRAHWSMLKNLMTHRYLDENIEENIPESVRMNNGDEFFMRLKPRIFLPLSIYLRGGHIYATEQCGFHFYSDKRLCTGNVDGKTFWASPLLFSNINRINTFSLANKGFTVNGSGYALRDFINTETIDSVVSVRNTEEAEGGPIWRTA